MGEFFYKIYYRPIGRRATIRKFGGKKNYHLIAKGEREMRNYVFSSLKVKQPFKGNQKFKINFLTGELFIHQTLFCVYSFFKFLSEEEKGEFLISFYDDGTLTEPTLQFLRSNFSFINIITNDVSLKEINAKLPSDQYPFIYKKLACYPQIKKLVCVHINNEGLNSFFDSDMLFMEKPTEFISWLTQESSSVNNSFCIQDIQRNYGYNDDAIRKIWPGGISNNINAGMYAVNTSKIDFALIEYLIKNFETDYGSSYYLEQLLTAIILESSENLHIASKKDYLVFPTKDEVHNPTAVLHHYVDLSKEYYFKEAWLKVI